jgi:hypothetical protein
MTHRCRKKWLSPSENDGSRMNSIARDSRGRWLPGVVPNPGGRPAVAPEVRDLARSYGPEAIAKLAQSLLSRSPIQVAPAQLWL